MKIRHALVHALLLAAFVTAPSMAADDDEALKKDLTSVIALHSMPCGEVTAVTVLGQNDYAATCQDGNSYRVYQTDQGRVVVEKRQ